MRVMMTVLAMVGAAAPALASERTGYVAIAGGNLAAAEAQIDAERRIFPDRPELMLNLASVYRRTGRDAQARMLYANVLERPAIAMDLPSGAVASSHDLARQGLVRMAPQIATR